MAYIEEQEEQQSSMNVLGQQPQGTQDEQTPSMGVESPQASQPPSSTQAPSMQAPSTTPKKGAGSGVFTNLQQYIDANRPKTQQLAEGMVGKLETKAGDVRDKLAQQQQQYSSLLEPEKQRLASGQGFAQGLIQQAGQQELSEQDLARMKALREASGTYQGFSAPMLTQSQEAARQLEQQGSLAGQTGARRELLKETFASPTYTRGQVGLDEVLLQSDESARKRAIEGAKQATSGLTQQVGEARKAGREELGGIHELARQTQAGILGELGQAHTGLSSDLEKRLAEAQGDIYQQIRQGLTSEDRALTREQLELLGLQGVETQAERKYNKTINPHDSDAPRVSIDAGDYGTQTIGGSTLFDVDPNSYLGYDPTVSNIASQEQLARANALAKLAGQEQTLITDPTQVGSYQSKVEQGMQELKKAVDARRDEYVKAVNQVMDWNKVGHLRASRDHLQSIGDWATAAYYDRELNAENEKMRQLQRQFGVQTGGFKVNEPEV